MSAPPKKDPEKGDPPRSPKRGTCDPTDKPPGRPDSPSSPASKKLKERVSFFEKVWTGSRSGLAPEDEGVDVVDIEKRLEEERLKHLGQSQLETVTLRQTGSPRRVVHVTDVGPDGTVKAGYLIFLTIISYLESLGSRSM